MGDWRKKILQIDFERKTAYIARKLAGKNSYTEKNFFHGV